MTITLNPYLGFHGNAREAMEFYHSVFGGDLISSTFADFQAEVGPGEEQLIMHSQLTAPNGLVLMGSDTPSHMDWDPGTNYSVSLSGDDEAGLTGYWTKLSDGATILQPLEKAPWGDSFGMLNDKFGVRWLFNISAPAAA
jgi:PhnB protein